MKRVTVGSPKVTRHSQKTGDSGVGSGGRELVTRSYCGRGDWETHELLQQGTVSRQGPELLVFREAASRCGVQHGPFPVSLNISCACERPQPLLVIDCLTRSRRSEEDLGDLKRCLVPMPRASPASLKSWLAVVAALLAEPRIAASQQAVAMGQLRLVQPAPLPFCLKKPSLRLLFRHLQHSGIFLLLQRMVFFS